MKPFKTCSRVLGGEFRNEMLGDGMRSLRLREEQMTLYVNRVEGFEVSRLGETVLLRLTICSDQQLCIDQCSMGCSAKEVSSSAVEVSIPVVAGAFSWPDAGAGDLSVASDVDLSDLTCEVDVVGVVDGASVFGRF